MRLQRRKREGRYYFAIVRVCIFLILGPLSGCALAAPQQDLESEGKTSEPLWLEESIPSGEPTPSEERVMDIMSEAVTSEPHADEEPEVLLRQMTLREKVGQLFIVRPDALDPVQTPEQADDPKEEGVTALTDAMKEMLRKYPVGGIAMFSKNIATPDQIAAFNKALQEASEIPLFLAVDEEGGLVSRLGANPAFDLPQYASAADVASKGNPADAQKMGETIGEYLRRHGFNMDFAPDADVNTNPENPVIGKRAFSSNAATAAQMAAAMAEGLRRQEVIAVFKHFPGHGDTAEDSHHSIAVSHKTKEEMEVCEWLPFEEAGRRDCIMVGHIAVPEMTGNLTPATMSHFVVTETLKGELNFSGLVITDSMAMGAVTENYSSAEAALCALQAGCEVLLMPYHLQEAFDAVVAAVEDGAIPEEALNEIVRHVLQFKKDHGIWRE